MWATHILLTKTHHVAKPRASGKGMQVATLTGMCTQTSANSRAYSTLILQMGKISVESGCSPLGWACDQAQTEKLTRTFWRQQEAACERGPMAVLWNLLAKAECRMRMCIANSSTYNRQREAERNTERKRRRQPVFIEKLIHSQ